jgi:monoamine oxidase
MIDLALQAAGLSAIPVAALLRQSGVQGPLALLVEQSLHAAEDGLADASASQTLEVPGLDRPDLDAVGLDSAARERQPAVAPLFPLPVPGLASDPLHSVVESLPASALGGLLLQDALTTGGMATSRAVLAGSADGAIGLGGGASSAASAQLGPVAAVRAALAALLERTWLTSGAPLERALHRLLPHLHGARGIVGAALSTLPGAQLLVCHGVDLEYALGAPPRLSLVRQLAQLRMLCLAGAGRTIAFVPCDPWRPECVGVVRQALDRGFAGVSLAGSCVQGLAGAAAVGRPRRGSGTEESREAERRLHEVLQHCATAGVPVAILLGAGPVAGRLDGEGDAQGASTVALWAAVLDHRRLAALHVALVPGGPGFSRVESRLESGRGRRDRPTVEVDDALEAVLVLTSQRANTWCALSPALGALGPAAVAETLAEARILWGECIVGALRRSPALGKRLALAGSLPQGEHALVAAGRENLPRLLKDSKAPRAFEARLDHANAVEFLALDRLLRRCGEALSANEVKRLSALSGTKKPRRAASRRAAPSALRIASAASAAAPIDCIVIGAGIAGITAAERIGRFSGARAPRRVVLVEAGQRVGGRLHTWRDGLHGPLELGAELVHRPPIDQILGNFRVWDDLRRFGLGTRKINKLSASFIYAAQWADGRAGLRAGCAVCGDPGVKKGLDALDRAAAWTTTGSKPDQPAAALLDAATKHGVLAEQMGDLLLTGTVPGRLSELSSAALAGDRVKDQEMSTEEFHVSAGFDALAEALARSVDVQFGFRVERVAWGPAGVTLTASDGRTLSARTAVCTVSVGVLKSGAIQFSPPLPLFKQQALDRVQMGPISKAVLFFERQFWPPEMSLLGNLDPQRRAGRSYFVPLYGADPAAPVITALFNGDLVRRLDTAMHGRSDADSENSLPATLRRDVGAMLEEAAEDLRAIFGGPSVPLQRWRVRSWANDPLVRGGTSFVRHVAGSSSRASAQVRWALREPTPPLFWAGEATAVHTNPWSVHGAHASGIAAALAVLG